MHKNKIIQLRNLVKKLSGVLDPQDNEFFKTLVSEAILLAEIPVADVAKEFSISRPSVERWMSGLNAPYPAMRLHIYNWFRMRAEAKLSNEVWNDYLEREKADGR